MRTAVFGGTFNPIHNGHISMITYVLDNALADNVVVIPANVPPHKVSYSLASPQHRLKMCELAVSGIKNVTVSDIEIARGEKSYTIDTLLSLKENHENLSLVCGGDMIKTFTSWYRYTDILKLCDIIAFKRHGIVDNDFEQGVENIKKAGGNIFVCDTDIIDISSTQIRNCILENKSLDDIVPNSVAGYIAENELYADICEDFEKYKDIIKPMLTEKRYIHSLEVAKEAKRLAIKYGADANKAYLAGLLHDILKTSSDQMQLQTIDKFGIILTDIEKNSKKLWHAISGAAYVKNVLNIDDVQIIDAIRYHTTARANMTLLDKILYLADFTSADRDYDDVDVMRRLVDESLQGALEYALEYTINDLKEKGAQIHPDTLNAYFQITNKE